MSVWQRPLTWAVVWLGFVTPINYADTHLFVASGYAKTTAFLVVGFFLYMDACGRLAVEEPLGTRSLAATSRTARIVVVFLLATALATVRSDVPEHRMILFGAPLIATAALFALDRRTRGGMFTVVLAVSVMHLLFALLLGSRALATTGVDRLTGGTHPELVGFEAAMVVLVSLHWLFRRRRERMHLALPLLLLGTYCLAASFSRAAIVACAAAAGMMFVFSGSTHRSLRFVLLTLTLVAVGYVFAPSIEAVLGGRDASSLAGLTGRTHEWSRIWSFRDAYWLRGYGYGALGDGAGPDQALWVVTNGQPSENGVLQVLLVGGVALVAVWAVLLVGLVFEALSVDHGHRPLAMALVVMIVTQTAVNAGVTGPGFQWWWVLGVVSLIGVAGQSRQVTA